MIGCFQTDDGSTDESVRNVDKHPGAVKTDIASTVSMQTSGRKTDETDAPVKVPVKTVIKIESPRSSIKPAEEVKPPVVVDKRDSDSISSASSLSQNSSSDQEVSPVPKRQYKSPTLDVRKHVTPYSLNEEPEYMNSPRNVPRDVQLPEYMNVNRGRKIEGGNSSDTDSGVGGDSDRPSHIMGNGGDSGRSLSRHEAELQEQEELEGWESHIMDTGSLLQPSELQLDLSKY